MPRKSKRSRNYALNSNTMATDQHRISDGEVFRNFFAVVDDIDPREALKHLKDMFRSKLDGDVVTMIFTECGYNVNQALENLMALNDDNQHSSDTLALENSHPLSKSSCEDFSNNCDTMCLPENSLKSNAVSEFSVVTNTVIENQAQCNHQNFISFSNHDASEISEPASVSQLKDDRFSSKESQEFENQQPVLEENLKTITLFHDTYFPAASQPAEICPSSPFKSSISLNMSPDVKPVTPTTDSFVFCTSENTYTPEKPNCNSILHTPLSFQSKVNDYISPAVGNSLNIHTDCDYVNGNKSAETLFSKKVDPISKKVSSGLHVLIILRGLPGSGKTTLAKQLKSSGSIFSTDDYFYVNGKYVFDYAKLSEAHEWNRKRTIYALKMGITPVIIDNTNIESWEMIPYIKLGLNYQYEIQVLEPNTPWKFKPGKLAKKNIHKVPQEKIRRMLNRYDSNKHIEDLIETYQAIFIQKGKIRPSKFYKVPKNELKKSLLKDKNPENSVSSERNSQDSHSVGKHFMMESCNHDSDNVISLEAIVHQADESDDSKILLANNKEIGDASNAGKDCSQFSNAQTKLKIDDLNDLKVLTQEDSEESHNTISQQLLSADSNQELSSWEAITELDKDFVWTTDQAKSDFNDISEPYNSESGSKSPNPQDIVDTLSIVSLGSSESSISSSFENRTFGQKSNNQIHNEDNEKLKISNTPVFTNTSFETSSSLYFTPARNILSLHTGDETPKKDNKVSISNERVAVEWKDVDDINFAKCTWDDKTDSEKEIFDIKEINVPKPQRLLNDNEIRAVENTFNSLSLFKQNDEIIKTAINSDQSVNAYENCSGHCWQFPAFPSGFLPSTYEVDKNLNEINRKSQLLTCSESQTEAGDFVLLNEIVSNPLCISNFKILEALKRPKETSMLHQSKNIEKLEKDYKSPHYEKSTSTDDISENIELSYKVKTLKKYFPRICEEDLKHFLELCHGDVSWLTDILFEWGYKYNNPTVEYEHCTPNIPEEKSSMTSDWSYIQQSDNTPNHISCPMTPDWSDVQHLDHSAPDIFKGINKSMTVDGLSSPQFKETVLNIPEEIIKPVVDDWSYGQQLDDFVSNTWEVMDKSTTRDWPDTQQLNENFINAPQKSEFNDIEGNASVTEINPDNENMNIFDKEKNYLNEEQKCILNKLTFTIDSTLASALEIIFGPITDQKSGSLSSSYRKVTLDFDTAKILYYKWKETVQSLPPTGEKSDNPSPQAKGTSSPNGTYGLHQANEPLPLSEIMDMEYALQLQQKEQMENSKPNESYIAVKLKRQKIYEMFPGVDTLALDNVFEANNYSLDETVFVLEQHLGKPAKVSGKPFSSPDLLQSQIKQKQRPDFINQDWNDQIYPDAYTMRENSENSTISTEAERFRNEAVEHYHFRNEFMSKAHAAHKRGMQQLASFYAQEGNNHKEKGKEANKSASEIIIEERNRSLDPLVLDLHGLYVKEAIPHLGKFLRWKKQKLTDKAYGGSQFVTVLTGRGVHSLNGAKLRPSVIKYLKTTGYRFSETNAGIFSINMAACPTS